MSSLSRLYLDHAATTPIIMAAREAMVDALAHWANPSSPHAEGRAARAAIEDARHRIAASLNWDGEIIFTSGASEALSLALWRANADATLLGATEHDAVFRASPTGYRIAVNPDGLIDLTALEAALTKDGAVRPIVAVQSCNNETGVLQPMQAIRDLVRNHNGIFLADCSQSAGKMALPEADLIPISAHKLGGPPGIGALLVRNLGLLSPTGGQEKGYRGGTENVPAIMGFAAALEANFAWMENARKLRAKLDDAIIGFAGNIVGGDSARIATIASYQMPGVSAASQLIGFDMAGISVSAGSACSSGTLKTSHVLGAMGWDAQSASEVIRVSFGSQTCADDIDRFLSAWGAIKARAKKA